MQYLDKIPDRAPDDGRVSVHNNVRPAKRRWQRQESLKRVALLHLAIAAGRSSATIAGRIVDYACIFDSQDRLTGMLRVLPQLPPEAFWIATRAAYDMCDDTWRHRAKMLRLMRQHKDTAPARRIGKPDSRILVYRGCSEERVWGISWFRDYATAEKFAIGHHGIGVPEPVVASGYIHRRDSFMYLNSRQESEVVLDPDKIEILDVAFEAEPLRAVA